MERNRKNYHPHIKHYFCLQKSCQNLKILASKINAIYWSQNQYFNIPSPNDSDLLKNPNVVSLLSREKILSNEQMLDLFYKEMYNSFYFSGLTKVDTFMIEIKKSILFLSFSFRYDKKRFFDIWNKKYKQIANEKMMESFNQVILIVKLNEMFPNKNLKNLISNYLSEFHLSHIAPIFFGWNINAGDNADSYYPDFNMVFSTLQYVNNTVKQILESVNVEEENFLSEIQNKVYKNLKYVIIYFFS